MVECPSCDRADFKTERGMKQHHTMVHDECLTEVNRECAYCGESVKVRHSDRKDANNVFCDDSCRSEFLSNTLNGENNPNWNPKAGYIQPGSVNEIECRSCGKTLPLDEEHFHKEGNRFVVSKCKKCWHGYDYGTRTPHTKLTSDGMWECAGCGEVMERNSNNFHKCGDGFQTYCKDCHNERTKEHWLKRNKLAEGHVPNAVWEIIKNAYDNECAYCGESDETLHRDHVVALTEGGSNKPSNIVPACPSCNHTKSNQDVVEWYKQQQFYDEDRLRKVIETPIEVYNVR